MCLAQQVEVFIAENVSEAIEEKTAYSHRYALTWQVLNLFGIIA